MPIPKQRARPFPVDQGERKLTKSERTRAEIVNAAFDFLWSHPYRDLSVNVLMDRTGVSRPTFYQYFPDLQALVGSLLENLVQEILSAAGAWLEENGDPVAHLVEALSGLVDVCHERGPFLRAVADAATTDARLEASWKEFLQQFDRLVAERIEADQRLGLIRPFDARGVAMLTTRMDALTFIDAFGQHPRQDPEPILQAILRVWISTLYGPEWVESGRSDLVRKSSR